MKNNALALVMLLLILSLVDGMRVVEVAKANFVPGSPSITIDSPEENKTYTTSFVWLNITLLAFYDSDSWNTSRVAEFSLDGEGNISISLVYEGLDEDGFSIVTGSFLLSNLTKGSHTMKVYATYNFLEPWNLYYSNSKPINFAVDLPEPTPTPTEETTPLPTINTGPSPYYFYDFLIGGIAGAVAIAVLVLLFYFTKRK